MKVARTSVDSAFQRNAAELVAARLASVATLALAVLVAVQLLCAVSLARRAPECVTVVDAELIRPMAVGGLE